MQFLLSATLWCAVLAAPCLAFAGTEPVRASMAVEGGADLVLAHTSVSAEVQVGLAVVSVSQHFTNPYDAPIDATYVFPLPVDAAVRDMRIRCGERTLVGEILDREAARKRYEAAAQEGRKAGLLEQQRTNVFTQRVASICPGEDVDVDIEYVEQLRYEDGRYELTFPTTLGPRFDPGDLDEPPLIPPTRDAREVAIEVRIHEGLPVESVWSDTHEITVVDEGSWGAEIELTGGGAIPNKDFVLGWMLAGADPKAAVVVDAVDATHGTIALTLEPQLLAELDQQRKRELLFVLDSSCSMQGEPWAAAVDTVMLALDGMQPEDTFNLVKFSDTAGALFSEPRPATPENVAEATHWLQSFQGGGTRMRDGIVYSLGLPHDPESMRLLLMLTDGYIGSEADIFEAVEDHLGDSRVFALGVGSSVNRMLLEGVARMGRGSVAYQLPGASMERTVADFYRRIAHPAMTDIEVEFDGLQISEQYPSRIPDLWTGQPVRIVAKYRGEGRPHVQIRGMVDGQPHRMAVPVDLSAAEQHEAVTTLWARRKIEDLSFDFGLDPTEREKQVTAVALAHHLVSDFTSLVAVEDEPSGCGPALSEIDVPSYQPAGVTGVGALRSGYGSGGGSFGARGGSGIGTVGGSPIILGSLSRTTIDDVIKRHLNQIRYCYQRELTKHPELAGKVVMKIVIAPDGTVREASIKSTTLNSEVVEKCLVDRFAAMRFDAPAGGGEIVVSYPFLFTPK